MSEQSDTPRTDAVMPESTNWHFPDSEEYKTQRKEMQRLERELTAARAEIDKWEQIACDKLSEVCRQIENTRLVTEQRDGLRSGIDYASDQLHTVTEQRDRLTKSIEPLKYWRDISECDCSNPLPQGGCLRCDLDRILNNQ